MPLPFTQTTVSIWTHLKPKVLEYCDLLKTTPSYFVNDIIAEVLGKIEEDQPELRFWCIEKVRHKLGKDPDVKVSEMMQRQRAGIDPVAEEVKEAAGRNTALTVRLFLRAKRRGWTSEKACRPVCGRIDTELTRQLVSLYESSLVSEAAKAEAGSTPPPVVGQLYGEVYQTFFRHGVTLAVAREMSSRFQPW